MKFVNLAAFVFALLVPTTSTSAATMTIYFADSYKKPRRCFFKTRAAFDNATMTNISHLVGDLTYKNLKLTQIRETIDSESGDWMVFDTYRLDAQSNPTRLERVTNTCEGEVSIHENFQFTKGRPVKASRVTKDLKTRQIINPKTRDIYQAHLPVKANFPYPKHMEQLAKDYCEQSR